MKKVVKGLFGILLAFVGLVNANAWTVNDVVFYGKYSANVYVNNAPDYNSTNYSYYKVNNENKEYSTYCIDATKSSVSKNSSLIVKENIDGSTSYERGLLAIAAASNDTQDGRIATNIAIRVFMLAAGEGVSDGSDRTCFNYRLYNTAAKWMSENQTLANKAFNKKYAGCETGSCYFNKAGLKNSAAISCNATDKASNGEFDSSYIFSTSNSIVSAAKALFLKGLNAAASDSIVTNGSEVKVSTTISPTQDTVTVNGDIYFVRYDYYEITLGKDDTLKNISVSCPSCGTNKNVSIVSYYKNNGKEQNISNLSTLEFKGEQTITFKIKTSIKADSGYKCEDLKVNMNYIFESPQNTIDMVILGKNDESYQRFLAFNKNGNGFNYTKELNIDFCGNNACAYYDPEDFEQMTEEEFEKYTEDCCTDLDNYCEDKGNKNRDYYCDLYSEYCGACDTEIVIPEVCTYIEGVEGEDIAEDMTGYVKSAVDEDGKSNIKACLLMRKKDEAGNSYKAMENSYCKVYCKEDYSFNLPTAVSINSGTYFKLDATVTGTKTCYTSEINTAKFTSDISSLSTDSQAYKDKVAEYNACTNMDINYDCFNPEIEYEYEEIYNDQLGENNKFVLVGNKAETIKDETTYCNSDINDDYSCKDSSTKVTSNNKDVNFTTKYVKRTITKTGLYTTPSIFYTKHQSGTITTDSENATLVDGLPVSIKTEKGRHKFTLNITNLGELYDPQDKTKCKEINGKQCCNGRIVGDKNSIINKQVQNGLKTTSEYMCYYDVNCPECEFDCEGPLCDLDFCDGNECTATCLGNGCAYDTGAGLSYAYRTVTLGSLNPNGRDLGYNWDVKKSAKASETIAEIEANGENAYKEAEYSFTLTPAVISAIKEYNKTKLNNGGYADESLKCNKDGINCESKFISDLTKGESGLPKAKVSVPEKKFTSWLESDYCNGTCTITKGSGIGPSWK